MEGDINRRTAYRRSVVVSRRDCERERARDVSWVTQSRTVGRIKYRYLLLHVSLPVCLFVCLFVCLSVYLSVCLCPMCLSVYLSVCPCLICLSVCQPIAGRHLDMENPESIYWMVATKERPRELTHHTSRCASSLWLR